MEIIIERASFVLAFGVTLKYLYYVIKKGKIQSLGSLLTIIYLTIMFGHSIFSDTVDTDIYIFAGIILVLLDKILSFLYDLIKEIKWCSNGK